MQYYLRNSRGRLLVILSLPALSATAVHAQSFSYPITKDTYIDSGVPTFNEGGNTKVKAVDNPASQEFPGSTSTTRALFTLPTGFWTELSALNVVGANYKVEVNYYFGNNSLAGYSGGHVTGPNPRDVELHPMTTTWQAGIANNTANGALSPGATWLTSDGTTPWTNTTQFPTTTFTVNGSSTTDATNVGGDYDIARETIEENNAPAASSPFSWNITSMLTDPTAYSELNTYGALLKITNDTAYDTDNDIQYFVSLSSAESSAPPNVTITLVPEPTSIAILGLAGIGLLSRRKR